MAEFSGDYRPLLTRVINRSWVGRVREMAEVVQLWHLATSGHGQVAFIHGEPGIGKTRFVTELANIVSGEGAIVLKSECFAETGAPYDPLQQLFQTIKNRPSLVDEEEFRGFLKNLIEWTSGLDTSIQNTLVPGLDSMFAQQRIFETFTNLCSRLSSQAPLLIFIDDVQWAENATLLLLKFLARRGRELRLLLVMSFRNGSEEINPALNQILVDLNRERLAFNIGLAPLNKDETKNLLAAMFSDEITPEFLDGIYSQTQGNPFFIEEICKALVESGELAYQNGRWHRPSMADMKLPQTIRSAIQDRLQKLPPITQEMLRIAAIIGREFDFETLKIASELDEEDLIKALETAIHAQLIVETDNPTKTSLQFSFIHVLFPITIRESMIHLRRRQYHKRVAETIKTIRPDNFEPLAYHYSEAGNYDQAREYYVLAGEKAQHGAPIEAALFFQAALNWWPEADPSGRAKISVKLGDCLSFNGDYEGSRKSYETAYHIYNELGDRTQSGEMQRRIGRKYWEQADHELALDYYSQALRTLEQGPETPELAGAISSIAQFHMLSHENQKGILWGERALALAERLGAEEIAVHALNNIGNSYAQDGDFETGLQILKGGLQRALSAGSVLDACRTYYGIGVQLQRRCQYAAAKAQFEQLHAYASKAFARAHENGALWRLIWIDWCTGKWENALKLHPDEIEFTNTQYTVWAKRISGMLDLDLGNIEGARVALEESLDGALRAKEAQTTVPHYGQLIRVYDALNRESQVVTTIANLMKFITDRNVLSIEYCFPLSIACKWLANHPAEESSQRAQTCLEFLEKLAAKFPIQEPIAVFQEARGSVLFANGQVKEAAECFQHAAILWETIGRQFDQARSLGYLGVVLQKQREPSNARAVFHQASSIYQSLAAQLDPQNQMIFKNSILVQIPVQGLQEYSSKKLRQPAEKAADLLTDREIEVLQMVSQGLTNAQIGKALFLSPLTVNAHLRSIFDKLDVKTRTAAVHRASELGIL